MSEIGEGPDPDWEERALAAESALRITTEQRAWFEARVLSDECVETIQSELVTARDEVDGYVGCEDIVARIDAALAELTAKYGSGS